MRRSKSLGALVAFLAGSLAAQWPADAAEPVAFQSLIEAGMIAEFTCSGHFIAGRSIDQIREFELNFAEGKPFLVAGKAPAIKVDARRKTISVPFNDALPPIRAAYREGLGCSVLPFGAGEEDGSNLARLSKPRKNYDRSVQAWPANDQIKDRGARHPRQKAIDRIVEQAFDSKTYGEKTRTIGVVVIHKGRVVAERYRPGFGPHVQYRTWSTGKSLVNAMIGTAIQDKIIDAADSPTLIPEWSAQDDPRRAITIENLLHMSSGLATTGPDGPDTVAGYWGGINTAAHAVTLPPLHAPGKVWAYSNYDSLLLMRTLKARFANRQDYVDFPYSRLFDRIGMHDTFAETDYYGNYVMSSQVFTTARDLARFAFLFLKDGMWGNDRVLPAGWATYSCIPTANKADFPRYGKQWWIFKLDAKRTGLQSDSTACSTSGGRGQNAAFIPEHDLVIVRTGLDDLRWGKSFDVSAFFGDIVGVVADSTGPKKGR